MRITAKLIKTILLNKFRYKDGLLCSSEVSITGTDNIADILAYHPGTRELTEVEIKISKSDLLADLHKMKHKMYESRVSKYTPTKFYYAVPTKLVEVCKDFIDLNSLKYGVIEIVSENLENWSIDNLKRHNFKYSSIMKVVKRGPKLSENKITNVQERSLLMRMCSELATNTRQVLSLETKLKELK